MAWYIAVSIAQENVVRKYLSECITEPCMIESGIYQQWQTTDRPMLITHIVLMAEFFDKLNALIYALTAYSYVAKYEARHLTITQKVIMVKFPASFRLILQKISMYCSKCTIGITAEQLNNRKTQTCEKISKVLRWLNLSNHDYPRCNLVIFVKTNGKYACDGIVGTVKHLAAK